MEVSEKSDWFASAWHWFFEDPVLDETTILRKSHTHHGVFFTSEKFYEEVPYIVLYVVFTILFFRVRSFVESRLRVAAKSHGVRKSDVNKFTECGFYAIYYVIAMAIGLAVFFKDEWDLFPTVSVWSDWPTQHFTRSFRTYYLAECAFYSHAIVYTFLYDARRSDFRELVIHHFSTIILVFASYWFRFHRTGLLVLLAHNPADIFLYSTKAIFYWNKREGLLKDAMFGLFAVSFLLSRLVFLPFVVIPCAYWDAITVVGHYGLPHWTLLNSFLWILQSLHVFWFVLILKMIIKMLVKGEVDADIRSDDESHSKSGDLNDVADQVASLEQSKAPAPSKSASKTRRKVRSDD
eukprot:ANDGO_07687.mRNA.1 ASC1-like protein 3